MDRYDIPFMERALALARKGAGLASPNPMVGAVIVRDGELVGEGFHQYQGRDHAEIVALKAAGEKARGATLYVTLEPCCHTGRTGPCTGAILAAGIRRVVAAMQDPNPAVAGQGFEQLRAAGVEADCGVLEEEARRLNEPFACWIRTRQPLVTLKSALTLDGQLALPQARKKQKSSTWITSEESRAEVHRLRHASDALLTGIGTILADDPLLTDRSGLSRRRRLLRVVLDSRLRLPPASRIVETADNDLLVFTLAPRRSARVKRLERAGVEIISLRAPAKSPRRIPLRNVLQELGRRDILSVLLEAGSELNGAALAAGIVHKLVLFYAPKLAGETGVPFARVKNLALPPLEKVCLRRFGPDFAIEGYLRDVYGNH
ncbi:MAG: bifunctional diaminohydroxyphosphoribosylaminopyrimidine deaminase/5-amino-6-(5-phosphoribosylamino)uracil reductase RibD [Acidobacteriia bacterium]|nr:bifunctional diaminohydroxyphosphoribosylaminopyrimidine deaminase/5-amino-6-(5-phosphoribosylamino)uracil reductase RibD [Terriglobia bacterium]